MVMVLAPTKKPPEPKGTEPRNRRETEPEPVVAQAAAEPEPVLAPAAAELDPEQVQPEVAAAPAEAPQET
jgi:hypothetical protein